ncbi:MAG: NAD(P)H-dependent oxidoreductase subunit E [bacterium]
MKTKDVLRILEKQKGLRGGLISILQGIQSRYGYLPYEALKIVSEKTGESLVDIYGIATFYKFFSLKPKGKHLISVCMGTACHVRGSQMVVEEFKRQLKINTGETTPDNEFTLEAVNCLGACALGPIVVVDGHYFSNVNAAKVCKIIKNTSKGLDVIDIENDPSIFPVENSCLHCNHSLMDPEYFIDGYPSIRVTVSYEREHGWFRLSCLWGSFNIASENKIPLETIMNFFCPHCHAELISTSKCADCSAPMVPMIARRGGMVQICSRRGCKNHILDLSGIIL